MVLLFVAEVREKNGARHRSGRERCLREMIDLHLDTTLSVIRHAYGPSNLALELTGHRERAVDTVYISRQYLEIALDS
jgi:hypothetical protein